MFPWIDCKVSSPYVQILQAYVFNSAYHALSHKFTHTMVQKGKKLQFSFLHGLQFRRSMDFFCLLYGYIYVCVAEAEEILKLNTRAKNNFSRMLPEYKQRDFSLSTYMYMSNICIYSCIYVYIYIYYIRMHTPIHKVIFPGRHLSRSSGDFCPIYTHTQT